MESKQGHFFNGEQASFAARLSELAYESEDVLNSEFKDYSFQYFAEGPVQFFLLSIKDTAYIAFKGTNPNSIIEILTDLEFAQKKAFVGKVHKGFYNAFVLIQNDLDDLMNQDVFKGKKVVITGHSLGGALATLCSVYFCQKSIEIKAVYTFGQPRVGNPEFAAYYDSILREKHFSVFHKDDRVPRLPGSKTGKGKLVIKYLHVGLALWINHKGELFSDYVKSQKTANKTIRMVNSIKGHSMEMYREVLVNNQTQNPFENPEVYVEKDIQKRKLWNRKKS